LAGGAKRRRIYEEKFKLKSSGGEKGKADQVLM